MRHRQYAFLPVVLVVAVTLIGGLFNDATALVALRTAIAAGAGGVEMWRVGTDFLVASVGGAVIGFVVFYVVARLRRHIADPILDTAISFVIPYATYIASEELHSSGVVSVVVAGLLLGHKAPIVQTAQSRIAERMNWRTIAFFLRLPPPLFRLVLGSEWFVQRNAVREWPLVNDIFTAVEEAPAST